MSKGTHRCPTCRNGGVLLVSEPDRLAAVGRFSAWSSITHSELYACVHCGFTGLFSARNVERSMRIAAAAAR